MTATQVDGVAVVATEPAFSNWKNSRTGEPFALKQVVRLLLEDGREVFGCTWCDYSHERMESVRPHLNKHRDEKRAAQTNVATEFSGLVAKLQAAAGLAEDRDRWKARAVAAERELAKVRKALGALGLSS